MPSFRWVQLSLDYICKPNRPSDDLLSVLENIPGDLYDFYFRLLEEVLSDQSQLNRERGRTAIAILIAARMLDRSLTADNLLFLIFAEDPSSGSFDERSHIDKIQSACHHLVVWNEKSRAFEFEHFSVVEFLTLPTASNPRWSEALGQISEIGRWHLISQKFMVVIERAKTLRDSSTDEKIIEAYQKQIKDSAELIYWGSFHHGMWLSLLPGLPDDRRGLHARSNQWRYSERALKVTPGGIGVGSSSAWKAHIWDTPLADRLREKTFPDIIYEQDIVSVTWWEL